MKADGYFGAGAESVVKRFQKRVKVEVDGIVGARTWFWLRSENTMLP